MSFYDEIATPRHLTLRRILRLLRALSQKERQLRKAERQKDWIDRRPSWEQSSRH